jgi:hypothetical protein
MPFIPDLNAANAPEQELIPEQTTKCGNVAFIDANNPVYHNVFVYKKKKGQQESSDDESGSSDEEGDKQMSENKT